MPWWSWRTRRAQDQRVTDSDEIRQRSERLRQQLLATVAELDEWVAALQTEVHTQHPDRPGG